MIKRKRYEEDYMDNMEVEVLDLQDQVERLLETIYQLHNEIDEQQERIEELEAIIEDYES